MISGFATPQGTARYASRFPSYAARQFYRTACGLQVSSLGLGSYLGNPDEATDAAYTEAAGVALAGGVNLLDTAINYRHQRSERSLGAALALYPRDEIVVCTKAGFLTPGAVPDFLSASDVVGRMHSMAPEFLADQIDRSRANLGIETIDVFYLHNPETQLQFVPREDFDARLRAAFGKLEELAEAGRIRYYGTATWNGYREANQLQLPRILELAREAGGAAHRFRFIQAPLNLAAAELYTNGTCRTATEAGIEVVASATLHQGRLTANMPDAIQEIMPECPTDPLRAIQFSRSTPGVCCALVGMSSAAHVRGNLAIAGVEPLTPERYAEFYR